MVIGILSIRSCKTTGTANRPSADFSTHVALKANLHPAIRVNDYRDRIAVEQGFIQGILALVNPTLFILNALATPRVAQPVGGRSHGKSVNYWNIGHFSLLSRLGLSLRP